MKKVFLFMVVALLCATGIFAQPVVTVDYVSASPVVDGNDTEGIWSNATKQQIELPFSFEVTDNTGYWQAVHDGEFIYVLISVTDDENVLGDPVWEYDVLQVFFDMDNIVDGTGAYAGVPNYMITANVEEDQSNNILSSGVNITTALSFTGNNADYVAEFAIPLAELVNSSNEGAVADGISKYGFDVCITDRDSDDDSIQRIAWTVAGNTEAWNTMDDAGQIILAASENGVNVITLQTAINLAQAEVGIATEGSEPGQYSAEAISAANTAIASATAVLENPVDQNTVNSAVSSLAMAMNNFKPVALSSSAITINFTETQPTLDGGIDELWSNASVTKQQIAIPYGNDVTNNSGYWQMIYDDEFIYLLVSVTDNDNQFVNDPNILWEKDAVEIFFDMGPELIEDTPKGVQDGMPHYMFHAGASDDDVFDLKDDNPWEAACTMTGANYVIECKFPFSTLLNSDYDEAVVDGITEYGFDLIIDDLDAGDAYRNRLMWSLGGPEAIEGWNDMDPAGHIVFAKKPATIDVTNLQAAIMYAQTNVGTAIEGSEPGQYSAEAISTVNTAIASATAVLENPVDQNTVNSAVSSLAMAMANFKPVASSSNITVNYVETAPLLDGDIDASIWSTVSMQPIAVPMGTAQTENIAYWQAVHDNENIYVLVSVIDDDNQFVNNPGIMWQKDAVELYFDMGPDLTSIGEGAKDGKPHYQCTVGASDDDVTNSGLFDDSFIWDASCAMTGANYVIEYKVPFNSLLGRNDEMPVADGQTEYGFDINVIDLDESDVDRSRIGWVIGGNDEGWNSMDNAGHIILAEPIFKADVTLNINMNHSIYVESFDPEIDILDVAGTFNNWNGTVCEDTDNDGIYTVVVPQLIVDEIIEFKFRSSGAWDGNEEFANGGSNRSYTVVNGMNDITMWYNDVDPLEYDFTNLYNAIDVAAIAFENAEEGSAVGQYTAEIMNSIENAIFTAYDVLKIPSTQDEINSAVITLSTAMESFLPVALNTDNLSAVITIIQAKVDAADEGTDAGQYPSDVIIAANNAIATAQGVITDATDQAGIDEAISALEAAMTLFVPVTVGIENMDVANFGIYPNPTNEHLTITNLGEIKQLSIHNILGKQISVISNTSDKVEISTSELSQGVYFIKLYDNNSNIATLKFVKK